MPFDILEDTANRIIEVVYPANPTDREVADYAEQVKAVIDAQSAGGWSCLVDQSKLLVMAPEMVTKIGSLNSYAQSHGMLRSARVVATAVATLQATRMAREACMAGDVQTFVSRDAAIAWIMSFQSSGGAVISAVTFKASAISGKIPRRT